MAVEEEDEEWEMKDRIAEGELEEEVKTPTTASFSHRGHGLEDDGGEGMGSTVALNQVNVLDKGQAI
jgi:hypothetical protein